ncbi:AbrB/MazE/SpoVT family DNA-binding domain-containing protein [Candidatus Woesearchaeota archaeon]|nr:AbrB/MazE/SpoVT family DNA-binding domain-containing protein [Candidatus Woesearchaeota archaeon]
MKRKVSLHGPSTLTISLPSKWTKENDIKKGDELNIEEKNDELIISFSDKSKKRLKADIDLKNTEKEIAWPLLALMHKKGYDEIKISFNNSDILNIIQKKISSTLVGFEIIEQTKDSCTIKSITEGFQSELDNILRKIFSVTISLSKNSLEYIKTGTLKKIDELLSLEKTNNKLPNLCERILNIIKFDLNNRYLYTIVWLLESIADDYRDLCIAIKTKNQITINKETEQIYEKVNNLFEDYHILFYTFSLKNMALFIKNQKQLTKEIMDSIKGHKDDQILAVLLTVSKRLGDLIGATLSLKIKLDTNKE